MIRKSCQERLSYRLCGDSSSTVSAMRVSAVLSEPAGTFVTVVAAHFLLTAVAVATAFAVAFTFAGAFASFPDASRNPSLKGTLVNFSWTLAVL